MTMTLTHLTGIYRGAKRRRRATLDIRNGSHVVCRTCCPNGSGRFESGGAETPGYVWRNGRQRRCPNGCSGGLLPSG